MAVVYQHTRVDTNEIFYIGIGSEKRRAYSKYKRSQFWHNIVNKVGYTVEILYENIDWEKACEIEKDLIKKYGRKDLKQGRLINMTDGGDGRFGSIVSEETKKKMSKSHIGKIARPVGFKVSEETKEKIKEHIRIYGSANKGRITSDETKEKIKESLIGRPGTWIGKKHTENSIERMRNSHGRGEKNKNYGRKNSLETIKKMQESAKNREKVICPHCKKEGQKSAMYTWHFNKCKLKSTI
jgi:hypothetical protein